MSQLSHEEAKEILRLKNNFDFSYRNIYTSTGISRATIADFLKKVDEKKVTVEQLYTMKTSEYNDLFYPNRVRANARKTYPSWEEIYININAKGSRKNISTEYARCIAEGTTDSSYSAFNNNYRLWASTSSHNVYAPIEHKPGRELLIDWVGDTVDCVVDQSTRKTLKAYFFITTLGYSGYPYVEACRSMDSVNWLNAHKNALKWYGGVPVIFVPDNCKTAIVRTNDQYNPVKNKLYAEFARHYKVAIMPARVRKPRDKAGVENSVSWTETWLLEKIKDHTELFESYKELNKFIITELKEMSDKPFKERPGSRTSNFFEFDLPKLRPLPTYDFNIFECKQGRVPLKGHIGFHDFWYSVPYQYIGAKYELKGYQNIVEIIINNEKVASHARKYYGTMYVTNIDHLRTNDRKFIEDQQYDSKKLLAWANSIGSNTYNVIAKLISKVDFEIQANKSCLAILRLGDDGNEKELELVCAKGLEINRIDAKSLIYIKKNKTYKIPKLQKQIKDQPTVDNENIREDWE